MTAEDALVAHAVVATALLGLVFSFGVRFATPDRTQRFLERLVAKRFLFQIGAFLLVAGIAVHSIADAVRYLTALPENDLQILLPTSVGYFLVILGVGSFVQAARHGRDRARQG